MFYKLNESYYPHMFFEKNTNFYSYFNITKKLAVKVYKLLIFYFQNFYHAQKLEKQVFNKGVKPKSYALNDKV